MPTSRFARKAFVATASLLAVASLGGTAHAASTLSLTGDAVLVAKGAAVSVTAAYSCPVDTAFAGLSVFLNQRVNGGRVAQGNGSATNLICDDTVHLASILVQTQNGNAFKPGDALAQAGFQVCDPNFTCRIIDLKTTIRVKSNSGLTG